MELSSFAVATAFLGLMDEAICIADDDSNIVYVNNAFANLFGYEFPVQMIELNISDLIAEGQPHPHRGKMSNQMTGEPLSAGQSITKEGPVNAIAASGEEITVWIYRREMFRVGANLYQSCYAREAQDVTPHS